MVLMNRVFENGTDVSTMAMWDESAKQDTLPCVKTESEDVSKPPDEGLTEAEAELYNLLDLDPSAPESKETFKLNERAIVSLVRLHKQVFKKMYRIDGYWINKNGSSALKAICSLGASLETIKMVYDLNPEAAFDALCECCFGRYSFPVVEFLVESNPLVLDRVDDDGRTVLHCNATCPYVSRDIIKYLVSQNESRLLYVTKSGSTPLHLACNQSQASRNVRFFTDKVGQVLKAQDNEGKTPLHAACSGQMPLDVVKYLIEKCPSTLQTLDMEGNIPLHIACGNNQVSLQLIDILLAWDKRCLSAKNKRGSTALHIAASATGRAPLVQLLVERNPSVSLIQDNKGLTPIHLACAHSDLDTVKVLRAAQPRTVSTARGLNISIVESLKVRCHQNFTPFVYACVAGNMSVVEHLAEKHPESLQTSSEYDGWYPLHFACAEAKTNVITFLIKKYPEAVKKIDKHSRSALAIFARRPDYEVETLKLLIETNFDAVKIIDEEGNRCLTHAQKNEVIALFIRESAP